MADRQYAAGEDGSAPFSWPVTGDLELLAKSVYGSFNGAAAAGPFVPCLRILSDAGTIVAECILDTTVAAGASADVSWFQRVKPQTTVAVTVLQGSVSSVFPNPSGPDYAAASIASHQFDYWVGFDLAVDPGVLSNLAANGCDHLVFQGSPTTYANSWVAFGINEPGPGFNVPTFTLEGRSGYQWFGGPAPASDTWYHVDLHVVYDVPTLQFRPVLFINGVNQGVTTNYSVAPGPIPGDEFFYFGTGQFCGGGVPSNEERTWLKNVTVGTTMGGTEISDLTTAAALHTAITNGSGDNPAVALTVLSSSPF